MKKYDLISIGSGAAGSLVSQKANKQGLKTAIIDNQPFGGTCGLRGCVPKKILHSVTEVKERFDNLKAKGLNGKTNVNWEELIKKKKKYINPKPENFKEQLKKEGIDAYKGTAKFISENELEVDGQILKADKIIIATGASPRQLDIVGNDLLLTSDDFLEMDHLPGSLIFVGGGYIAMEFAFIAKLSGANKVQILHRSDRILKQFDPDLVNMMLKKCLDLGIEIYFNTSPDKVERRGDKIILKAKQKEFDCDKAFLSAGRIPNVFNLNLEKANVKMNKKGIEINEYLQSVSNQNIFVSGDATGRIPLTPVASMESKCIVETILNKKPDKPDYAGIPSVVFTSPPLASVGMQEKEAYESNLDYKVNFEDSSEFFNSFRIGQKYSAFKIITEKKSGKILGAHLYGEGSEEVINIFALAIREGISTSKLENFPWTYPTFIYDVKHMFS